MLWQCQARPHQRSHETQPSLPCNFGDPSETRDRHFLHLQGTTKTTPRTCGHPPVSWPRNSGCSKNKGGEAESATKAGTCQSICFVPMDPFHLLHPDWPPVTNVDQWTDGVSNVKSNFALEKLGTDAKTLTQQKFASGLPFKTPTSTCKALSSTTSHAAQICAIRSAQARAATCSIAASCGILDLHSP